MTHPQYPFLAGGVWKSDGHGVACYACHEEIPAGEVFFSYGEDGQAGAAAPATTPYHRDCALYIFGDGPKPAQLFGYVETREELAAPLPEPAFNLPGEWRTARRMHVCRHCTRMIRAKERYFDYTGESALYQPGRPYHRRCAIEAWSDYIKPPEPAPAGPQPHEDL